MNRLEKFSTVFLVAGLVSFLTAFGVLGLWPALMTKNIDPKGGLPTTVPPEFAEYYSSVEDYQKAIFRGRDIYISEGCWHCHSQYVRPISNENAQFGLVSTPGEYENDLNRPQLFGTRRVGPDLIREAGKRTNDWHFAHFYDPRSVEPASVMPGYTWYYDESTNPPTPKADAVALVAYVQNLGRWASYVLRTQYSMNQIVMPPSP